jgi:hypothetical protein
MILDSYGSLVLDSWLVVVSMILGPTNVVRDLVWLNMFCQLPVLYCYIDVPVLLICGPTLFCAYEEVPVTSLGCC